VGVQVFHAISCVRFALRLLGTNVVQRFPLCEAKDADRLAREAHPALLACERMQVLRAFVMVDRQMRTSRSQRVQLLLRFESARKECSTERGEKQQRLHEFMLLLAWDDRAWRIDRSVNAFSCNAYMNTQSLMTNDSSALTFSALRLRRAPTPVRPCAFGIEAGPRA
jgi:hypothetical protein